MNRRKWDNLKINKKNNKIKKAAAVSIMLAAALVLSSCGSKEDKQSEEGTVISPDDTTTVADSGETVNRETLYQVSLLQGLTLGDYNGNLSVGSLKKMGDTGLGTFEGLNGELIMVDGKVSHIFT